MRDTCKKQQGVRAVTECRCSPLPYVFLLSQTQLADNGTVALDVSLLQVVQKISSVTDHLLQTAAAVEVLLVGSEVLGQVCDAVRQDRNLNLRRTGVSLVGGVLLDDAELFFFLHGIFHLSLYLAYTQRAVGEVPRCPALYP